MPIEEKKIKVVKTWLKPKFIRDILVFIGFANFYQYFIKGFGKIVVPFTSILKITSTASNLTRKKTVLGGIKTKNLSKNSYFKTDFLIPKA